MGIFPQEDKRVARLPILLKVGFLIGERSLTPLFGSAQELEMKHSWPAAARIYEDLLSGNELSMRTTAEAFDRMGRAYYHASFHANSTKQFQSNIHRAIVAQRKAGALYSSMGENAVARGLRCRAMDPYLASWLTKDPSSKKSLLHQSWTLAKKAMMRFRKETDAANFAETFSTFAPAVPVLLNFERSASKRIAMFEETIRYGRRAIGLIPHNTKDKRTIVKVYVRMAALIDALRSEHDQAQGQESLGGEGREYWRRAIRVDRESALAELPRPPGGFGKIIDNSEFVGIWKDAVKVATRNRDAFGIGWLHTQGAAMWYWEASLGKDNYHRVMLSKKSLRFAENAAQIFDRFNFTTPGEPLMWPHSPYAEHFLQLSSFEVDQEKRKLLLTKTLQESAQLEKVANRSMYPKARAYAHHIASKVRAELARGEVDPVRKKRLVAEAVRHRAEACAIVDEAQPGSLWTRAVFLTYLAQVKRDLAEIEKDRKTRKSTLLEAIQIKKKALELSETFVNSIGWGKCRPLHGFVAKGYSDYGEILALAHQLLRSKKLLAASAGAFTEAVLWTRKSGGPKLSLGIYSWMAGHAYDSLHDYSTAAAEFLRASRAYHALVKEQGDLGSFYDDRSRYLWASAKVEEARGCHGRLEYEKASTLYAKAAKEYRTTRRWNFLAPYYKAMAELENAEALSQLGERERSIQAFEKSSTLFQAATCTIQQRLGDSEQPDERRLFERPVKEPIMEYCRSRILIEEARLAENEGNYQTGIAKFQEASKQLKEISTRFRSWGGREEILPVALLSEGWGLMTRGTTEGSTRLLQLARDKFERSFVLCTNENSRQLARGYALLCRGMEASAEFADAGDSEDYENANRYFTRATDCFQKSGFTVAYYQANAARYFLDAQFQLAATLREEDQAKKTVRLRVAVAILQNAADSFQKAGEVITERDVTKLIERLREDESLSSSLVKVSNVRLNSLGSFAFPVPTRWGTGLGGLEENAGLDIEASVINKEQPSLGKDRQIVIKIVNLGTKSIRIVRLDNIVPEGTLILNAVGSKRIQGAGLIMDGRRIDPSKVETIPIVLRTEGQGITIMRPRLVFDDDAGKRYELSLQPKILTNSPTFEFLSREFLLDYDVKQLAPAHAGWRTLMEIVSALKIPRNRLYGDPRRGRRYGREIEALMKVGLVELRVFPGERGRGGQIVKARLAFDNHVARQIVEPMKDAN
jgi:tetratricopeptide (TPR) repeat protein